MTVGMVQTVLGDVEPSSLGMTMTHEHLLITFGRWQREAGVQSPVQPPQDPRASQPISMNNLGWVRRYWSSHPENSGMDDEALAIEEAMLFKNAGGGTMVDATNPDLKRDPEALVRISQATGLHVVMGAGHYVDENHPLDMDERTEEDIFIRIVADVTEGCDGTTIKAGIIGEIGCSAPLTANEAKALRAAAS